TFSPRCRPARSPCGRPRSRCPPRSRPRTTRRSGTPPHGTWSGTAPPGPRRPPASMRPNSSPRTGSRPPRAAASAASPPTGGTPMREAVIVDAVRTPIGKGRPGGALHEVNAVDLLAHVLAATVERTGIDPAEIDDVIGGIVTQAGEQAANMTRRALLAAGYPESVPAATVDRQCGSSQQAVHFAAQGVIAGAYDIAVAAGAESMGRVPMGANLAGSADPLGEGYRERYPEGHVGQGIAAELIAARWGISRRRMDEYALTSHARAAQATRSRAFDAQLAPVAGLARDEGIREGGTPEVMAGLRPAYHDPDTAARFPQITWDITAGNSSPLS